MPVWGYSPFKPQISVKSIANQPYQERSIDIIECFRGATLKPAQLAENNKLSVCIWEDKSILYNLINVWGYHSHESFYSGSSIKNACCPLSNRFTYTSFEQLLGIHVQFILLHYRWALNKWQKLRHLNFHLFHLWIQPLLWQVHHKIQNIFVEERSQKQCLSSGIYYVYILPYLVLIGSSQWKGLLWTAA